MTLRYWKGILFESRLRGGSLQRKGLFVAGLIKEFGMEAREVMHRAESSSLVG